MGQTLFQRLVRGPEVVEYKYFNPLRAKIGSSFSLDVLGFRDLMFTLREIHQYERKDSVKSMFGDYVLLARPIGKEDVWVTVRLMPVEVPDANLTHNVLLLQKYDEMPFCKPLDEACRCGSGELEISDNDTGAKETYYRLAMDNAGTQRITRSFDTTMTVIRDVNNDGKVEDHEVQKVPVEYWNYSRITRDEAGQDFTQYLFVEFDKKTRLQTMWRGEEVDAQRVTVL